MKNLKNAMLALGLTSMFGLGACGGDLAKVEDLVDEMCACKDKACFDKVEEKAKKALDQEKMEKLMKDEPEAIGKLIAKSKACEAKLQGGDEAPAEGE